MVQVVRTHVDILEGAFVWLIKREREGGRWDTTRRQTTRGAAKIFLSFKRTGPLNVNIVPEYENEEKEQGEEDGHVVHGAQHDDQLAAQVGHEADQLQNAQETERSQNRQARTAAVVPFEPIEALKDFHQTKWKKRNKKNQYSICAKMWRRGGEGDICIPEDDDDSVENVESVADVVERTLGDDFEQHLNGEDGRENDVAEFDRQRQFFRLFESMKSNKNV